MEREDAQIISGERQPRCGNAEVAVVEATSRGQKLWSMYSSGRVYVGFIMGNAATELPTLAYGRTWSWHGFRCNSATTGLTCRNTSGHGFFLSRESQRVF